MEITYSSLSPFSGSTSAAVGDAAGRLRDLFRQIQAKLNDSFSLGGQEASLEELRGVLRDCGLSDWDGYEAESVSLESYERAKRVILSLPFDVSQPEISADPNGEISLEWYRSPSRVFSVSVGSSNELNYAGLFGASRAYGTEVFHDEIPPVVLSHIKRTLS
jgi:hypothetical protein